MTLKTTTNDVESRFASLSGALDWTVCMPERERANEIDSSSSSQSFIRLRRLRCLVEQHGKRDLPKYVATVVVAGTVVVVVVAPATPNV